MTNYEDNLRAATDGLVYALRDLWSGPTPATDEKRLQEAERLAVGGAPTAGASPPALRSIFSTLKGNSGEALYLPYRELALDTKTLFPESLASLTGSSDELCKKFREAVAGITAPPQSQPWFEGVLDALQRYAWCLPAPQYGDESDVSLYDHARITSALTVCLANGGNAAGEVALLVGGDLSGVQEWLYTLASSGAAKSLRGRSFYLQLLMEVVAFKFLDALNLPLSNLVYVGGGNFYLLAPVTVTARIASLAREIGSILLGTHEGELYLAVDAVPVAASQLQAGKMGAVWDDLNRALRRHKNQRYASLGKEAMATAIGVALRQGGKPDKVCSVCQRENPEGKEWSHKDENDEDVRKCDLCVSLEELGSQLPNATHLVISRLNEQHEQNAWINTWQDGLRALGYDVQVVNADGAVDLVATNATYVRVGRSQPQPGKGLDSPISNAYQNTPHSFFYRPLINVVPRVRHRIATFDEFCKREKGIERWGVLRMDVDDLGKLFQDGLGEQATLTRTTQMSFGLRLFFEGRLNEIGRCYNLVSHPMDVVKPGADPKRDRVYAMYSGGDDLFIVGAWDALPHLARDICHEFHAFVGKNPKLTLSGGISLVSEKFPLYQAAYQAGGAEGAAKDFERPGGHDKDALTFLGQTFGWEEFAAIWDRVAKLQSWIDADPPKINRSLIQTLRAIDAEYQIGLQRQQKQRAAGKRGLPGQFYYGPWMWKLVYQLTRVADQARRKDNDEVTTWIEALRDELVTPQGPIVTLGLTARWAEYLTRQNKEGKSDG